MKLYQLYVRIGVSGWRYADTYQDVNLAYAAMMLARAKGCVAKMVIATQRVNGIHMEVPAHG